MPATLPAATSPTISLSASDRERLYVYVHRGHSSARTRTRAQVLLKLGEGWSDVAVCQAFDVCRNTVKHVRSRSVGNLLTLRHRVSALETERNAAHATIRWQFTSQQARVTLTDLYPVAQSDWTEC